VNEDVNFEFEEAWDYVAPVRELPPMPVSDMVDEDAD